MHVNEIFQKLHEIAASPKAQKEKYLAQGKRVVLVAAPYTPEEIVHSMGCIPMGAWGADITLNESKKYFPAFICSVVQSIVELGIHGDYEGCSAIVIPSLCDSLKVLGQNFKYAVPSIPFIPMTYPQNRRPAYGEAYTLAGYARVIADLEQATGAQFSQEKLQNSIVIYNQHNDIMRQITKELVKHPEVSAQQRSDVFKSAFFMEKAEHTAIMEDLLKELKTQKSNVQKIPVVISGILADAPALNAIFDKENLQIVADDVAAQSRQYRTDAPEAGSALESLAKKFCSMGNCSLLYDPAKGHVQEVVRLAQESNAKGVIIILTKFCDPEEFDYPLIKKACASAEIPLTVVEIDRQMSDYAQVATALEAFSEMLH